MPIRPRGNCGPGGLRSDVSVGAGDKGRVSTFCGRESDETFVSVVSIGGGRTASPATGAMLPARLHSDVQIFRNRHHESRRLQRSEEHTSELQSLMRISYAVFCLKKKKTYYKNVKKSKTRNHSQHLSVSRYNK